MHRLVRGPAWTLTGDAVVFRAAELAHFLAVAFDGESLLTNPCAEITCDDERGERKMLIQTMTGFENFQQSSSKAYAFVMPCREFPGTEEALGQASRNSSDPRGGIRRHGPRNRVQAAPGLTNDFGHWTSAAYEVPEGIVLKLYAARKTEAMTPGRHLNASMLVRMREGAPLIRVWAGLTGDERATFSRVNIIEGRMDVLTPGEGGRFGVQIRPQFRVQFNEDNCRLMFEVETMAPAMSAAPIVGTRERTNAAGEAAEVTTMRRRRALDL